MLSLHLHPPPPLYLNPIYLYLSIYLSIYLYIYIFSITFYLLSLSLTLCLSIFITNLLVSRPLNNFITIYYWNLHYLTIYYITLYFITLYITHTLSITIYDFYRASTSPIYFMTHKNRDCGDYLLPLPPILFFLLWKLGWESWGEGGDFWYYTIRCTIPSVPSLTISPNICIYISSQSLSISSLSH